jgi:hypothetical protein
MSSVEVRTRSNTSPWWASNLDDCSMSTDPGKDSEITIQIIMFYACHYRAKRFCARVVHSRDSCHNAKPRPFLEPWLGVLAILLIFKL